MNEVILIGRLVRDPEMRTTGTGVAMTQFTIAVNRPVSKEKKDEQKADFISCVAWKNLAVNIEKYCKKGALVSFKGHINTRSFDDEQGQRQYRTDIVADKVTFLSSNKNSQTEQYRAEQCSTEQNNLTTQEDPFKDFGEEITLSDDDLPF